MAQEHLQARSTMTVGEVEAISRDLAKAQVRLQATVDARRRLRQVDVALRDLEEMCGKGRPAMAKAIKRVRSLAVPPTDDEPAPRVYDSERRRVSA